MIIDSMMKETHTQHEDIHLGHFNHLLFYGANILIDKELEEYALQYIEFNEHRYV